MIIYLLPVTLQKGQKIDENFYMRHDGTRAYYFSKDVLQHIFHQAGFEVCLCVVICVILWTVSCDYVARETINIKEGVHAARVFVQARFRKCE